MIKDSVEFKFNIGDKVSGHKHGIGTISGIVTGRARMTMGTLLYWIKDDNGHEFKIPQQHVRGSQCG